MKNIEFWKDRDRKIVNPDLFSTIAEKLAKMFHEEGKNQKRNKRSQLRKFYDEIYEYKETLKSLNEQERQEKFELILPYLNMIIAKVAYAKGRKLVTESFVDFIKNGITNIKTPDDLFVFADLFESIMGFYRIHRND